MSYVAAFECPASDHTGPHGRSIDAGNGGGGQQSGALGSIAVGATDAKGAAAMIGEVRARTDKPFNVNLFVHAEARRDVAVEAAWIETLRPIFQSFCAEPPASLKPPYKSFAKDDEMLAVLCELAPPIVSFHSVCRTRTMSPRKVLRPVGT